MIFVNNDDVLGKNIRHLRQRKDLSLGELAEIVGMDPDTLCAVEEGILMDIDALVLKKICRFFHMDVETLVEKKLK